MTTITAELAEDILDASYCTPGEQVGEYTFVTVIDGERRRWAQSHTIIVIDQDGQHWGLRYDRGLTEEQESKYPWRDGDEAELTRLYPHAVTTIEYRTTPAEETA